MGAVDVGRQGVEVNFDDFVKVVAGVGFNFVVGSKVLGHGISGLCDVLAAGGAEVAADGVVVSKK